SASAITVLSLDPDSTHAHWFNTKFNGFRVLGQTTITDSDGRRQVAAAVKHAVRDFNGELAACFNPRHGLRLADNAATYDFVICYECNQLRIYSANQFFPGLGITGSPAV